MASKQKMTKEQKEKVLHWIENDEEASAICELYQEMMSKHFYLTKEEIQEKIVEIFQEENSALAKKLYDVLQKAVDSNHGESTNDVRKAYFAQRALSNLLRFCQKKDSAIEQEFYSVLDQASKDLKVDAMSIIYETNITGASTKSYNNFLAALLSKDDLAALGVDVLTEEQHENLKRELTAKEQRELGIVVMNEQIKDELVASGVVFSKEELKNMLESCSTLISSTNISKVKRVCDFLQNYYKNEDGSFALNVKEIFKKAPSIMTTSVNMLQNTITFLEQRCLDENGLVDRKKLTQYISASPSLLRVNGNKVEAFELTMADCLDRISGGKKSIDQCLEDARAFCSIEKLTQITKFNDLDLKNMQEVSKVITKYVESEEAYKTFQNIRLIGKDFTAKKLDLVLLWGKAYFGDNFAKLFLENPGIGVEFIAIETGKEDVENSIKKGSARAGKNADFAQLVPIISDEEEEKFFNENNVDKETREVLSLIKENVKKQNFASQRKTKKNGATCGAGGAGGETSQLSDTNGGNFKDILSDSQGEGAQGGSSEQKNVQNGATSTPSLKDIKRAIRDVMKGAEEVEPSENGQDPDGTEQEQLSLNHLPSAPTAETAENSDDNGSNNDNGDTTDNTDRNDDTDNNDENKNSSNSDQDFEIELAIKIPDFEDCKNDDALLEAFDRIISFYKADIDNMQKRYSSVSEDSAQNAEVSTEEQIEEQQKQQAKTLQGIRKTKQNLQSMENVKNCYIALKKYCQEFDTKPFIEFGQVSNEILKILNSKTITKKQHADFEKLMKKFSALFAQCDSKTKDFLSTTRKIFPKIIDGENGEHLSQNEFFKGLQSQEVTMTTFTRLLSTSQIITAYLNASRKYLKNVGREINNLIENHKKNGGSVAYFNTDGTDNLRDLDLLEQVVPAQLWNRIKEGEITEEKPILMTILCAYNIERVFSEIGRQCMDAVEKDKRNREEPKSLRDQYLRGMKSPQSSIEEERSDILEVLGKKLVAPNGKPETPMHAYFRKYLLVNKIEFTENKIFLYSHSGQQALELERGDLTTEQLEAITGNGISQEVAVFTRKFINEFFTEQSDAEIDAMDETLEESEDETEESEGEENAEFEGMYEEEIDETEESEDVKEGKESVKSVKTEQTGEIDGNTEKPENAQNQSNSQNATTNQTQNQSQNSNKPKNSKSQTDNKNRKK